MTVQSAIKSLRSGQRPAPPQEVALRKLVFAGIAAYSFGGPTAYLKLVTHARKPPVALLHARDLLQRFCLFLEGRQIFEDVDFYEIKQLIDSGLEAYGFVAPPQPPKKGPRKKYASAAPVRFMIARRHREFAAGRLSLESILDQCADQVMLDQNRANAQERGQDPGKVALPPGDATLWDAARNRMETAYHRIGPLTASERRNLRRLLACTDRIIRRRS